MTYILYLVKVVVLIISVIAWNSGQRHKKPSPRYWAEGISIEMGVAQATTRHEKGCMAHMACSVMHANGSTCIGPCMVPTFTIDSTRSFDFSIISKQ